MEQQQEENDNIVGTNPLLIIQERKGKRKKRKNKNSLHECNSLSMASIKPKFPNRTKSVVAILYFSSDSFILAIASVSDNATVSRLIPMNFEFLKFFIKSNTPQHQR